MVVLQHKLKICVSVHMHGKEMCVRLYTGAVESPIPHVLFRLLCELHSSEGCNY